MRTPREFVEDRCRTNNVELFPNPLLKEILQIVEEYASEVIDEIRRDMLEVEQVCIEQQINELNVEDSISVLTKTTTSQLLPSNVLDMVGKYVMEIYDDVITWETGTDTVVTGKPIIKI